MNNRTRLSVSLVAAAVAVALAAGGKAWAHCDTLDGPVVSDAKKALESRDVTPVLKWVKPTYETEARQAFDKTLKVRSQGQEARELADLYFFETLVRVHRAGEGAPYTGLKPAGSVDPFVRLLDEAIDQGSVDGVAAKVADAAQTGIRERFEKVVEAKKHASEGIEAGREFVEAYVVFIHYVEGLHGAIHTEAHHEAATAHDPEATVKVEHQGCKER